MSNEIRSFAAIQITSETITRAYSQHDQERYQSKTEHTKIKLNLAATFDQNEMPIQIISCPGTLHKFCRAIIGLLNSSELKGSQTEDQKIFIAIFEIVLQALAQRFEQRLRTLQRPKWTDKISNKIGLLLAKVLY